MSIFQLFYHLLISINNITKLMNVYIICKPNLLLNFYSTNIFEELKFSEKRL